MASIDVVDLNNKKIGNIELSAKVFDSDVRPEIMHSVVRLQLMNRRGGNAQTKGRSHVRGGGAKPWKQKGTGRARAGTSSSPIWVGGGTAFGPQAKTFNLGINKKTKRAALRSALSMKLKDGMLVVLDKFELTHSKTKEFVQVMKTFEAERALIVLDEENRNVDLSSRNVRGFKVMKSEGINVYDLLKHDKLFMTKESVGKIEEVLG
ncbi:MAG: 50S ribosomal protein L4 [Deltaproteobacteria bacterium]|nr:50S ribosomal protein L4 [Deltaproteobacteria bacterium]